MDISYKTKLIKQKAFELGFSHVGISKSMFLEKEAKQLEVWLSNNFHGKMQYMENYFDKRTDPGKLVDGAKSVISLLFNYHNPLKQQDEYAPKISQYAYGKDYHFVIKKKLKTLFSLIKEKIGNIEGRVFVDSAPIHERAWAKISGLGWIGKNSLLLNKKMGSYFFLAEIICDLELEYDTPVTDHCGTCTKCIDACPTNAITQAQVIDANKCISYLTIENKNEIPSELSKSFNNYIFGCDICQDVCPWNKFSKPHDEKEFLPNDEVSNFSNKDWEELTHDTFNRIFKNSAIKRTRFEGLQRNIKAVY